MFRAGKDALKVWPGLVDIIPEAKLNLAIFYLKNDDYVSAFNLLSDLEPSTPPVHFVLSFFRNIFSRALSMRLLDSYKIQKNI